MRFIPIFSQDTKGLVSARPRWILMALSLGAVMVMAGCTSVRSAGSSLIKPQTLFGILEPYRVEVVQGNVVTKEVMAQIQPGLTRLQVRDMLGSPVLIDVFHDNRWDYIFTIAKQGIAPQQRRVSIFFKGDLLERVEADKLPTEREFVASVERGNKAATGAKTPDLTPAQIAALPANVKSVASRKVPQGAVRDYPPLEAGRP